MGKVMEKKMWEREMAFSDFPIMAVFSPFIFGKHLPVVVLYHPYLIEKPKSPSVG